MGESGDRDHGRIGIRLRLFYPETRIFKLFQAIFTYKKYLKPNKYGTKKLLKI